MSIDQLIQQGWADHERASAEVAERLEASLDLIQDAAGAAQVMSLGNHTIGDHLGDRPRAARLCEAVAAKLGDAADANVHVYLAASRRLAGDHEGAAAAQRAAGPDPALGVRIGMIVAQGHAEAGAWQDADTIYRAMLAAAEAMAPGHAAERAVAVTSNNVASELLGVRARDDAADALMATAAEAAYRYWSRIGTWVNKERGEYLLSMVHRALGEAEAARAWAERGLATIEEADGEEPVDAAFLQLARAAACRDAGDAEAHAAALATASALAANFADEGLLAWFGKEHAKAR